MKPISLIVSVFLLVIAILHAVRLVFHLEVVVAGMVIPQWVSFFGCFFPACLGILLWREGCGGQQE
ncbi:hypothetical protein ACFL6N_00855 [Thermodesulfobacteriota bacterium]